MDDTTKKSGRQQISLLESLDSEWLKLPFAVMQDVGPATQTLGGLLRMTNKETFSAVAAIAELSRLPVATVRKHIITLDAAGWISNQGRERTRRGRPRRTATLQIAKKTLISIDGQACPDTLLYGVLPWWACCSIQMVGKQPWSTKAVLSIVMGRLMALKAGAEREGVKVSEDELIEAIENMGGAERFEFSLDWLENHTGLHRETLVDAKRHLKGLGLVDWSVGEREDGGTKTDKLFPNWSFRVIVTPTEKGFCNVAFDRGSDFG